MIYKKLKFDYKQDAIVNSAFRFLGTYKPDIGYRRGDITSFNKKYYVYINDTPTSNNNPTNETFWEEYLTAVDKEIYSKKEVDDNFVSKSDTNIVRKNVENTFTKKQRFQGGLGVGSLSHFYQGLYTYADPYPGEQTPYRVISKGYLENNYYNKQELGMKQKEYNIVLPVTSFLSSPSYTYDFLKNENINNVFYINFVDIYGCDQDGQKTDLIVSYFNYYLGMRIVNIQYFKEDGFSGKFYDMERGDANYNSLFNTLSSLGVGYVNIKFSVIYN